MAYWNPFGWSEETRRSIQSVVRPVMQVASMAASMGAFSGGGGTGTEGGAMDPTTGTGTMDEALTGPSGTHEWTTDMPLDAPKTFTPDPPTVEIPGAPQTSPVMSVPSAGTTTDSGLIDPSLQQGDTTNPFFDGSRVMPENATPFQDVAQAEGLVVEPVQQQTGTQYKVGDKVGQDTGNALEMGPGDVVTKITQPKPTQTTTQQPSQAKPPTTETPGKPPATKTAGTQEIKAEAPKPDGPGPGGQEISSWDDLLDKGLNWENIQKFLKSKEGLHWLLMDEKGFAGIGRKLTAAADAGVSAFNGLSPKERKKILDRLKKEREERKKKNDEENE